MAKRKLKKSVRNTLLVAGLIFTGAFITNAIGEEDHVMADTNKTVVEREMTYLEKQNKNDSIAETKNIEDGTNAFYLCDDGLYSVFMINDTKETVYVKKSVLKESFADTIQTGDNALLYFNKLDVEFVSVESGKATALKMLSLLDYNEEYTKIVYEDENTGEQYKFDKDFIQKNNLDNYANVGSMATGYVFDGEIVAVHYGW